MDTRLKRLAFRAHHMGSNENDIIFGRFADRHLAALAPEQLDRFEALLQETDNDLFDWVTGRAPVPERCDHDVMAMLRRSCEGEE